MFKLINKYRLYKNKKLLYIYKGIVNDNYCKYITTNKWDGKISVKLENQDLVYRDTKGDIIEVYDKNDAKYDDY